MMKKEFKVNIWHPYDIQVMPNPDEPIVIWYGNAFDFTEIDPEDWRAGWYGSTKEWAYAKDLRRASQALQMALVCLNDAARDTENEKTLAGDVLYGHVKLSARRCLHKIKDIMHQAITL